ncbi:MAG: CopG family transcriptional regulator [Verrucomicrobia bacterium]|nr:CopG family transcriptional regulator [Verrucomicrobiota bacterium]
MVTLRLPPSLERKLAREAKKRGRTKTALAQEAVVDLLQDAEDAREADAVMARIARGEERVHSSADVKRALGL